MPGKDARVVTDRLILVPIGPENAADYWRVHDDDAVAPWYDGWRPTLEEARRRAEEIAESWRHHGVHKWIAYERDSGAVVGRGGLSRTPIDEDWGQIHRFLPEAPWVREAHPDPVPFLAHAHWLEVGWALRRAYWGRGYATEIGRASLAFAFEELAVRAVVSCTAAHNARSEAVMKRIGLTYLGVIHSPGIPEGETQMRDDAPFATYGILRPRD